ncbi:MAG: hypothetical protein ACHQNA_02415 [Acidimicrobiales bacterium]
MDAATQRRRIWVAEARGGELRGLSSARTREETVDHLLCALERSSDTLVGLDFAFAFPAWWAHLHGAGDGPGVWELAAERGESWLSRCTPPFWGRPGCPRPQPDGGRSQWRRTERELAALGLRPKSTFQVGGAGSVGTGSIRGMPHLRRLRAAGVAVWPFDAWSPGRGLPVAVEVYPRWCTGAVVKSRAWARTAHLSAVHPSLPAPLAALAAASEDAFDAACTALCLSTGRPPAIALDAVDLVEGRVLPPPEVPVPGL